MFSLIALYHCRNCFTSWPSRPPASSPGDWLQNTEYRLLRSACLLRQALFGSWILKQQHQQSSSGEWYLKSFCFCAVFCSIQFQPSTSVLMLPSLLCSSFSSPELHVAPIIYRHNNVLRKAVNLEQFAFVDSRIL